jgi:Zn finger protein HypA/HybF involved in hydrogenase expression
MNLKHNLKGTKLCKKCKKRIEHKSPKQKYCPKCAREIEKENWVKRKRKQRAKEKNVTI